MTAYNTRLFNFKLSELLLKKIEEISQSLEMNKSAYVRSLIYFDMKKRGVFPYSKNNKKTSDEFENK